MNDNQKLVIRNQVLQNLQDYGISWDEQTQRLSCDDYRSSQLKLAQKSNPHPEPYKHKIQSFLAQPNEINISKVYPYLIQVDSNNLQHQQLWSYATSLWSIPITVGFGRRIRFFVFDKYNHKLIGIIGLCDPIIGLDIRDTYSIGWSKDVKLHRLYNTMTAYILGAIPPYNTILGSKLVALTLLFPEVRMAFYHKYRESALNKGKQPYLAYIDTLGAFGKSAIYNKLLGWEFIGYTKGQSHLHITANGSWEIIKQLVPEEIFNSYKFGQGPNWKMRVLRYGLNQIGFTENILSIGWRRGYYRMPLAENWQDFLQQTTNKIKFIDYRKKEVINYWKERWIDSRIELLQEKLNLIALE